MNVLNLVRKLFLKERKNPQFEYVKEYAVGHGPKINTSAATVSAAVSPQTKQAPEVIRSEKIIAFSPQGDLEAYVKGLNVPSEVIEGWISAGVLLPEETRVAAKMIRLMQQKGRFPLN